MASKVVKRPIIASSHSEM